MDPARLAVARFLDRLSTALAEDRVIATDDALQTVAHQLGWEIGDMYAVLHMLDEAEFHLSEPSTAPEGGQIWVFLPMSEEGRLWVRLCERDHIVLVSFHRG